MDIIIKKLQNIPIDALLRDNKQKAGLRFPFFNRHTDNSQISLVQVQILRQYNLL